MIGFGSIMARPVDASVREVTPPWVRLRAALIASMPLALRVFVLWLATRIGYVAVTYMANAIHLFQSDPRALIFGGIHSWDRWDTNWYLIIARYGYQSRTSANFFPLYPAAVGVVSWLLGHGASAVYGTFRLLVAIGLSNLGLLVGLYAVARLSELDAEAEDDRAGTRAAWILLAYPFAMAFAAPLAEGFFLAFAALSLLLARQGRWYAVILPALLAGLTRPFGLVLVAPLAWEYARQHGWWKRPPTRPTRAGLWSLVKCAVVVAAAPAGLFIYLGYLYVRFGDFLLPFHDQLTLWHHVSMPPWSTAQVVFHNLMANVTSGVDSFLLPVEVVLWISFALITIAGIRRTPFAYTLFMAGMLYVDIAAPINNFPDILTGTTRYLASAIPVFLILARWTRRQQWLETVLICSGMMLQGTIMVGIFQARLSA